MMSNSVDVSVIIPCFNAEKHISETMESILRQTYKNFEIIVINDGSTDKTKEILSKYSEKIKYIYQDNAGPAVARNRGIFESKGKMLAFCDADDIWDRSKLEKQMNILCKYPNCGIVSANGCFIDEEGNNLGKMLIEKKSLNSKVCELNINDMLDWARLYPSATIISKKAIMDTGLLFDSKTYLFENVLLWLRVAEKFKAILINESLVKRRYLRKSLSHSSTKLDRYAQVKVYSLALIDFPDCKNAIQNKLQHAIYSTSRLEAKDGNFKKSRELLTYAIKANCLLGKLYFENNDSFLAKIKKILAPYMLLLLSYLRICTLKSEW